MKVGVDASGEVSTSTAAVSKTEEAAAAAAPAAAAEYKEPEGEYATEP